LMAWKNKPKNGRKQRKRTWDIRWEVWLQKRHWCTRRRPGPLARPLQLAAASALDVEAPVVVAERLLLAVATAAAAGLKARLKAAPPLGPASGPEKCSSFLPVVAKFGVAS
jgi:hypothetical protein